MKLKREESLIMRRVISQCKQAIAMRRQLAERSVDTRRVNIFVSLKIKPNPAPQPVA